MSSLHVTTRINLALMQCAGRLGHRWRSRQIFGGAKDFFPTFLKLARKIFGPFFVRIFSHEDRFWNEKKFSCDSAHVEANFKKKQSTLDAIFARIFREFAQIFTDFFQISADFADFQEFCPNFHQSQNFWGRACIPASCTTDIGKQTVITRNQLTWIKCWLQVFKKILVLSPNFQGGQMPIPPSGRPWWWHVYLRWRFNHKYVDP